MLGGQLPTELHHQHLYCFVYLKKKKNLRSVCICVFVCWFVCVQVNVFDTRADKSQRSMLCVFLNQTPIDN